MDDVICLLDRYPEADIRENVLFFVLENRWAGNQDKPSKQ